MTGQRGASGTSQRGALATGMRTLELLVSSHNPLGVTEIAEQLELDKANAHRTLAALDRHRDRHLLGYRRRMEPADELGQGRRVLVRKPGGLGIVGRAPDHRLPLAGKFDGIGHHGREHRQGKQRKEQRNG